MINEIGKEIVVHQCTLQACLFFIILLYDSTDTMLFIPFNLIDLAKQDT